MLIKARRQPREEEARPTRRCVVAVRVAAAAAAAAAVAAMVCRL